jgi:hypothetical protein
MPFDVFISYSSHDRETADRICEEMESRMISCWIAPRNIAPGASWGGSIISAINGARVMIVVLSENANQSNHVLSEVERAINKGLVVVPFRIQDVTPEGGLELFLSSRHWLDAFADRDGGYGQLVETVARVLGVEIPVRPPPPEEAEKPATPPPVTNVVSPVEPPQPAPVGTPDRMDAAALNFDLGPNLPPRVENILYPPPPAMMAPAPTAEPHKPDEGEKNYRPFLAILWLGPALEFFRMWSTDNPAYGLNFWFPLCLLFYLLPAVRRVSPAVVPIAYYVSRAIAFVAFVDSSLNVQNAPEDRGIIPWGFGLLGVLFAAAIIGIALAAPRAREQINRIADSPAAATFCALVAFQWAIAHFAGNEVASRDATYLAVNLVFALVIAQWLPISRHWRLSAIDIWIVAQIAVSLHESIWRETTAVSMWHLAILLLPYLITFIVARRLPFFRE